MAKSMEVVARKWRWEYAVISFTMPVSTNHHYNNTNDFKATKLRLKITLLLRQEK